MHDLADPGVLASPQERLSAAHVHRVEEFTVASKRDLRDVVEDDVNAGER